MPDWFYGALFLMGWFTLGPLMFYWLRRRGV